MIIRYLETVTPEVADTIALLSASMNVKFSDPIAELGNAHLADLQGGGQYGVRAPMHDGEEAVTRSYFATNDVEAATEQALAAGGELAVPVMEIPGRGKFSLIFQGGNQFGFWQD